MARPAGGNSGLQDHGQHPGAQGRGVRGGHPRRRRLRPLRPMIGFATDTFSSLGSHTFAAGATKPTVTVSASDAQGVDGSDTAIAFSFARTGDISQPLTVSYVVGGTATLAPTTSAPRQGRSPSRPISGPPPSATRFWTTRRWRRRKRSRSRWERAPPTPSASRARRRRPSSATRWRSRRSAPSRARARRAALSARPSRSKPWWSVTFRTGTPTPRATSAASSSKRNSPTRMASARRRKAYSSRNPPWGPTSRSANSSASPAWSAKISASPN